MVLLLAGAGVWAGELPRARPEDVGFSATRLHAIDTFYDDRVVKGELAGIVVLIARHGKIAHFSAIGYADVERKQRLTTDAIFRLASMTKPIAAVALMMLYEEGRFQLDDPIQRYIPAFADLRVLRDPEGPLDDTVAMERPPTIHDVLRHTAGFTHGAGADAFDAQYVKADVFGRDVPLAEMMSRLAKIPLRYQPGTTFAYSLGPDIQARLVEVLSGMPFDEFLRKRLFDPLGMHDTGFWVPQQKLTRLAAVHCAQEGKLVPMDEAHGNPTFGPAILDLIRVGDFTANPKHKGGSAGLGSTAEDYWRFAQMLLNGGELDGRRLLSPQVVRYMARDHLGTIRIPMPNIGADGLGFGLGFAVMKDPAAAGYMNSEGSFFWSGALATHFWIDPKEDMVVVAMSQHLGVPGMEALWPQLRTLVYSALME